MDVNEEVIKDRIALRHKSSGRADDDSVKLIKRIDEYFNKTIHVLPYYVSQGKLITISGVGEITEISNNLFSAIENM